MPDMERHYKNFCNDLTDIFDKDWNKVEDKFVTAYQFLNHVPVLAWKPMVQIAVDSWDGWPRNWVKSVKDVYEKWRKDEHVQKLVTKCDVCNSAGYFSGGITVEVKPKVFMTYWHTWRCSTCKNWVGVLGQKIPASMPAVVEANGFKIKFFGSPVIDEARRYDLTNIVKIAGIRVNEKQNRPEIQTYSDDAPF